MAAFAVTVTASYDADQAPDGTLERLRTWAASGDGRTFVVDERIAPVRWTATADVAVDADDAQAAEALAVQRFTAEASAAGILAPETVLAATGPIA